MKPTLQLSIAQPCAEKWDTFKTTSTGGFCSSCNKIVVDFTKMGENEIAAFFQNSPAHSCGRFRKDQLKTHFEKSFVHIHPGLTLLKAGFVSLILFLVSHPGVAQERNAKQKIEFVQVADSLRKPGGTEAEGHLVRGFVTSAEDKAGFPGINVWLKGSTVGTVTGENGEFYFPRKLKEGDVLVFSFIGYTTKELTIPKKSDDLVNVNMVLQINLTMCEEIMMGEVAVNRVYATKGGIRGWWSKVKKRL